MSNQTNDNETYLTLQMDIAAEETKLEKNLIEFARSVSNLKITLECLEENYKKLSKLK